MHLQYYSKEEKNTDTVDDEYEDIGSEKIRYKVVGYWLIIGGTIGLLLASLFLYSINLIKVWEQNNATLSCLYEVMSDFIEKKSPESKSISMEVYGENTDLLKNIISISAEVASIQSELDNIRDEISRRDINNIFSNKDEISRAEQKIKICIDYFQKVNKKRELLNKSVNDLIAVMNISQKKKDSIILRVDTSNKDIDNMYREYTDNEIVLYTFIFKQYEYLKNNHNDKFKISNGKLIFHDNKDLSEYNLIIKEIQLIVQREGELIKAILENEKERLNKLNVEK